MKLISHCVAPVVCATLFVCGDRFKPKPQQPAPSISDKYVSEIQSVISAKELLELKQWVKSFPSWWQENKVVSARPVEPPEVDKDDFYLMHLYYEEALLSHFEGMAKGIGEVKQKLGETSPTVPPTINFQITNNLKHEASSPVGGASGSRVLTWVPPGAKRSLTLQLNGKPWTISYLFKKGNASVSDVKFQNATTTVAAKNISNLGDQQSIELDRKSYTVRLESILEIRAWWPTIDRIAVFSIEEAANVKTQEN
jgi:hypothetical protein